MKKSHFLSLTFPLKSDRLSLVSERNINEINNMKNEMRVERMYGLENHAPKPELFKCWNCGEMNRDEDKKDWGSDHVCKWCELSLFDEAEKREKHRW